MINFKNFAILSSSIFVIATTIYGLLQTSWPVALPFTIDSLRADFVFFAVSAVVLLGLSSILKVNRLVAAVVAAIVISIMSGFLWPLLVIVWFVCSSHLLGRAAIAILKISQEKQSIITTFLVGSAIYGTATGLAAHLPINYPGLFGLFLAAPLVWGWRELSANANSLREFFREQSAYKFHDLAIAVVALIHFSIALMPEVGHDALAMHLFVPAHLSTRHEWGFNVENYVWAVMPMIGDWLFSIVYILGGETAARLLNVSFIFILSWLIRDLVIWAGGNSLGVRWAVLLFLTTPLTLTESSSLFIESIWATFIIAGSLSVFKLLQNKKQIDQQVGQIKMAAILLGAGVAAKAVTLTILPALFLLFLLRYRVWAKRELINAFLIGLILFIVFGGVPYATAWYLTGNPVFPFFNHIFQSQYYPLENFVAPAVFGKGMTWDVIFQSTFHTETFLEGKSGATGFQWLLLLVPAFILMFTYRLYRAMVLFAVAVLSIALCFHSTTYLRYVFPSFVWVSAGIGVALSIVIMDTILIRMLLNVLGWAVVFLNLVFFNSGTYYADLNLQPLMSSSDREAYLNNRLPIRNAIQLVNRLNLEHAPVAIFAAPLSAGLNSDGLYPNWYNHQFAAKVTEAKTSENFAQLLMHKGVNYVILDSNWGTSEKREIIEEATDKISEQGAISVRRLKSDYQFQAELLKNYDLSSYDGWEFLSKPYRQRSGELIVSVSAPAWQIVSVNPGHRYRGSVTAMCKDDLTQGRVQINWLDSKLNFISTDIKLFDCSLTKEVTHTMDVLSPPNASKAAVYASSHTSIPIIIREVSLKQ